MKNRLSYLAALVGLAAVYFGAGKLGLSLAFIHVSASAVWPPTAIALAAVLIWGGRVWPALFLGAFLVNLDILVSHNTHGATVVKLVVTSCGIAFGNMLEALVGAWLVTRFAAGRDAFAEVRTLFRFVFLAGLVSTTVSATIGLTSLCLGGFANWPDCPAIWFTWWTGDLVSDITLAPLLLIWVPFPWSKFKTAPLLEALVLAAAVFLIGEVVFAGWVVPRGKFFAVEYLALPPMLWAAWRFGLRGASAAALGMSLIAIVGTLHGYGPFALPDHNEGFLLLQTFMATISLTALVLAAVVLERDRNFIRLNLQYDVARVLAESATSAEGTRQVLELVCTRLDWDFGAVWRLDPDGRRMSASDTWRQPDARVEAFEVITRAITFTRGEGLVGWVWERNEPLWNYDVQLLRQDFPRKPQAVRDGLRGAFGFPLTRGDLTVGVMEFFSRRIRQPEAGLMNAFAAIGRQIGQFIERQQAEQSLREAQARLRSHAAELEKRVAERTRDLREMVASLEGFCSSIAHDLRAPLRSIHRYIGLLADQSAQALDETSRDYALRIADLSATMDQLIQDLLEFGRLSSTELRLEPVDMDKLVRAAVEHLRPEREGQALDVHIIGPLPPVLANRAVVEQVVLNLLRNAAKFVAPGVTPQIQIRAEPVAADVRFWIQDNGIGIDPAFHETIFGVFERLHPQQTYPGTGIGLAIVKKGIERMGGRVGLESAPGRGSRFWFELKASS